MRRMAVVCVITMFFVFMAGISAAETYKIGVLAKNGPVKALEMWKATGDYLTESIPNMDFEVIPLDFTEVNPAIEKGGVDFLLVNSSMFVTAKVRYGATPIATMINSRQGNPLNSFGGVILTSIDNETVNAIQDLKGKRFLAVKKSSFGGWQMAYKVILEAGIDPFKEFEKVEFAGKHENVVLAVQNGAVEAGTVRTDTLERMAAEGIVDMDEFKIINQKHHEGFPFVCSTALYPEWPLAKLKQTPDSVADAVVAALKTIEKNHKAAKDAKVVGWVESLDYTAVEDLQESLGIGAYEGDIKLSQAAK